MSIISACPVKAGSLNCRVKTFAQFIEKVATQGVENSWLVGPLWAG